LFQAQHGRLHQAKITDLLQARKVMKKLRKKCFGVSPSVALARAIFYHDSVVFKIRWRERSHPQCWISYENEKGPGSSLFF
jgi:hypothetical protein